MKFCLVVVLKDGKPCWYWGEEPCHASEGLTHPEDGHPPNALTQLSLSVLSLGLSTHVGLRKGMFVSNVYGLSGNIRRIKIALMRLHSILECEVPIHFLFL